MRLKIDEHNKHSPLEISASPPLNLRTYLALEN